MPNKPKLSAPSKTAESLEERFGQLARQWWSDAQWQSAGEHIARHPAHRAIVDMGRAALPLILHDMRGDSKHWYRALEEISGENPVPRESMGDIPAMRRAWLAWGAKKGLLP